MENCEEKGVCAEENLSILTMPPTNNNKQQKAGKSQSSASAAEKIAAAVAEENAEKEEVETISLSQPKLSNPPKQKTIGDRVKSAGPLQATTGSNGTKGKPQQHVTGNSDQSKQFQSVQNVFKPLFDTEHQKTVFKSNDVERKTKRTTKPIDGHAKTTRTAKPSSSDTEPTDYEPINGKLSPAIDLAECKRNKDARINAETQRKLKKLNRQSIDPKSIQKVKNSIQVSGNAKVSKVSIGGHAETHMKQSRNDIGRKTKKTLKSIDAERKPGRTTKSIDVERKTKGTTKPIDGYAKAKRTTKPSSNSEPTDYEPINAKLSSAKATDGTSKPIDAKRKAKGTAKPGGREGTSKTHGREGTLKPGGKEGTSKLVGTKRTSKPRDFSQLPSPHGTAKPDGKENSPKTDTKEESPKPRRKERTPKPRDTDESDNALTVFQPVNAPVKPIFDEEHQRKAVTANLNAENKENQKKAKKEPAASSTKISRQSADLNQNFSVAGKNKSVKQKNNNNVKQVIKNKVENK